MNIDRGGFAIRPAPSSGDGCPSSPPKPDDAPAFRFDTGEAPAAERPRARAAAGRESAASTSRDDVSSTSDATSSARARPDRPAGARGEAPTGRGDREPSPAAPDTRGAEDATTARAPDDGGDDSTDETALPGLMLALLSGAPAATPTTPPVPADTQPGAMGSVAVAGSTSTGGAWTRGFADALDTSGATTAAAPAAVGLGAVGSAVVFSGAAATALDNAAMPAAGVTQGRPTVALPASSTPATDAAANLQALLAAARPAPAPVPSASMPASPVAAEPVGAAPPSTPAVLAVAGAPAAVSTFTAVTADRAASPEVVAFAAFVRERPERGERATPGSDGSTPLTSSIGAPREAGLVASAPRLVAVVPASAPLALDADFDDGLAGRVTWMADQRIDRAEIRVSPEGLGTIDIRLQMDGSRVHAHFHAANADVRQALEGGMDRLRDLLGRQGMELGQAQVGSGGARDDGRAARTPTGFGNTSSTDTTGEPATTTVRVLRGRGLLDEYA